MVVALYDEARSIGACLESLARQDYPPDSLEVLVFDGGSTDGSRAIAEAYVAERPGWSVHDNPRRIQAAAWNSGIRAASGEIVGIVSGHAQLGPSYVRHVVRALEETGADMVGGPVRATGDGPIGEAAAIAMSTPFGVGGARHHYLTEPGEVDTVFMGACRRETYLRFPFDERMVRNQDDELSYRLLDAGGRIVCDPAIESTYLNRSSIPALWRQFHDYGLWKVPVLFRHPRRARLRHLAPAGLVATAGLGLVLGTVSASARAATTVVLGAYLLATVGASARYRDRARPASVLALCCVYPTIHAAYGVGMIQGFARYASGDRLDGTDLATGAAASEAPRSDDGVEPPTGDREPEATTA